MDTETIKRFERLENWLKTNGEYLKILFPLINSGSLTIKKLVEIVNENKIDKIVSFIENKDLDEIENKIDILIKKLEIISRFTKKYTYDLNDDLNETIDNICKI